MSRLHLWAPRLLFTGQLLWPLVWATPAQPPAPTLSYRPLFPGPSEPGPSDQQHPQLKPPYTCEDFAFLSSFQQEGLALLPRPLKRRSPWGASSEPPGSPSSSGKGPVQDARLHVGPHCCPWRPHPLTSRPSSSPRSCPSLFQPIVSSLGELLHTGTYRGCDPLGLAFLHPEQSPRSPPRSGHRCGLPLLFVGPPVAGPGLVSSSAHRRASGLFPVWGRCEWGCCKRPRSGFRVTVSLPHSGTDTQQWDAVPYGKFTFSLCTTPSCPPPAWLCHSIWCSTPPPPAGCSPTSSPASGAIHV